MFKRILSLLLVAIMMVSVCFAEEVKYERGDDDEIYEAILGEYTQLMDEAKAAESTDERFVLYAKAEAALLDSAAMIPTTTQGGAYTISRIAPRSGPYVQWGNDGDRLFGLIVADQFLTPDMRDELLDMWRKAVVGEGEYNPAQYLLDKGFKLNRDYRTTFSTAPATLDWLNTSFQSDTELTVNAVDGLVEYNNLSQMEPALAESWEVSEDGLTYTFKIREGVKWYTSEGTPYADVTADDFVAGFQHMLDASAGLEWLVDGVVKGVSEYLQGGSFDEVGYAAPDKYTLVITLTKPHSYFLTMLTYSCFLPMCKDWYLAHGGAFGREEYAAAFASETYTFGKNTDVASQVYCGPFLVQKLNADSEIKVVKNENYYNLDKVKIDSITWIYDSSENMAQLYKDVVDGVYAGMGLTQSSGTLELAKKDGNFDKYAYVSDTTSVTYFAGLNLNRGTFALESGAAASPQTEQQKIDTHTAMQNRNFRKAIAKAFDKKTWNAVSRGEDLALANVRNMYCHPEFVKLENAVTYEGKEFPAGTFYGELVQYFLDQLDAKINVADGTNGWFDPDGAVAAMAAAKEELSGSVTFPINLDVVYYSAAQANTAQAQAYKQIIESTLGAENVVVNLVETTVANDFYACGYRAPNGEAGNFDVFYGSGWGPDFGDPCTYLDTFLGEGVGYMTKVVGLY
ncbi:MAG: ABC transporter substrate-binding protein [Christensenellales bacterium]|jgi:oligopeptide transport system substrate-binding protein